MDQQNENTKISEMDSKASDKFFEESGCTKIEFDSDFKNKVEDALKDAFNNEVSKKEVKQDSISDKISSWFSDHPNVCAAILIGGGLLFCYKLYVLSIAQAVFKGNLKTIKYCDKHGL